MSNRLEQRKQKVELLQQFLKQTQEVSALLQEENVESVFAEIEARLDARATVIAQVTALGNLPAAANEEEANFEWLCNELLQQIQSLEEQNVGKMDGILEYYKSKLSANKQDRETITAYSKQMYSVDEFQEGSILDHLK